MTIRDWGNINWTSLILSEHVKICGNLSIKNNCMQENLNRIYFSSVKNLHQF
jgi:hypothetical protein